MSDWALARIEQIKMNCDIVSRTCQALIDNKGLDSVNKDIIDGRIKAIKELWEAIKDND